LCSGPFNALQVSESEMPDKFRRGKAERVGFEPTRRLNTAYAISSRAPSANSDTSPNTSLPNHCNLRSREKGTLGFALC
jgi:hypothetical protein